MSRDVMNNRPRKPWRARTALTATLLAAVLGGGSAAAHAADLKQWELSGPDRATHADAEADISGLIYKCRRQNGNPINSGV